MQSPLAKDNAGWSPLPLCSSYDSKARRLGVRLTADVRLPKDLPLPDTELCSVVSNGLESQDHPYNGRPAPPL